MTILNDPSARVQVVGRGDLLHPGTCMLCGSGTCDEGYINLGVYYDYEGQMYLCMTCATQVAESFGCLTLEEAEQLRDLVNSVQSENDSLKAQLEVANERLNAIDIAFAGVLDRSGLASGLTTDPGPVAINSGEVVADLTEAAGSGEPEATESDPSDGRSEPIKRIKSFDLT